MILGAISCRQPTPTVRTLHSRLAQTHHVWLWKAWTYTMTAEANRVELLDSSVEWKLSWVPNVVYLSVVLMTTQVCTDTELNCTL